MKQDLYSYEWISAENQSAEINPKAYRQEVFLVISLKTLFENLNLLKSYAKTNPTVFVFSLWERIFEELNFFWPVYFWRRGGVVGPGNYLIPGWPTTNWDNCRTRGYCACRSWWWECLDMCSLFCLHLSGRRLDLDCNTAYKELLKCKQPTIQRKEEVVWTF